MALELTQPAKDLLAARGFDPVLGARPLRRTIQREIEDSIAEKMLYGELRSGQIVLVDVEGEGPEATFTFTGTAKADLELPEAGLPPAVEAGSSKESSRARGGTVAARIEGDQAVAEERGQATLALIGVVPGLIEWCLGDRGRLTHAVRRVGVHAPAGRFRRKPVRGVPDRRGRPAGSVPRAVLLDRADVHFGDLAVQISAPSSIVAAAQRCASRCGSRAAAMPALGRRDRTGRGARHRRSFARSHAGCSCRARRAVGRTRTRRSLPRCSHLPRAAHVAHPGWTAPRRRVVRRSPWLREAQRPTWIAELPPGPNRLARAVGRQRAGRRPPFDPGVEHREDPGDRRLLQHELRDDDPPRPRVGPPR